MKKRRSCYCSGHPGRNAAVLSGIHALQALGILPYFIGKIFSARLQFPGPS